MSFGTLLRRWRRQRNISQLALALAAGISARHLSFLESGRSQPSQPMVLRLARALDLPLRAGNELLVSAGFAPAWRETTSLDAPGSEALTEALRLLIRSYHPNPAIVMNRRWDILLANRAASRFSRFFIGASAAIADNPLLGNAAHLYLAPGLFRPHILEWESVAETTLQRVRREALADPAPGGPATLLAELLAYPQVAALGDRPHPADSAPPLLATRLSKDGISIAYATAITSFGTAQDVLAEELRIKTFLPMDEQTRSFFARLAARDSDLIAA